MKVNTEATLTARLQVKISGSVTVTYRGFPDTCAEVHDLEERDTEKRIPMFRAHESSSATGFLEELRRYKRQKKEGI